MRWKSTSRSIGESLRLRQKSNIRRINRSVNYMKKIIAILTMLIFAWLLSFASKQSSQITNYPSDGVSIVAFGDSLVEGVGATPGNDFPSVLGRLVGEPIINMGISGNTTKDGLMRVEEVNKENPKVVLVLFGGNDFLRKVPTEETFANLDGIISRLHNNGAVVVLLGVQGGIFSDQYDEHFKKLAKEKRTLYVPNVLRGILGRSPLMSDALHPNDAGYKKIAEKIYPFLQKAL